MDKRCGSCNSKCDNEVGNNEIGNRNRPHYLCKRCFATGIDLFKGADHNIRHGGLTVSFNPTVLRIWMAPMFGDPGPRVLFVAHLTDSEAALAAESILAPCAGQEDELCQARWLGLYRESGVWLRLVTHVPTWVTNGMDFDPLLVSSSMADSVPVVAYLPFASHNRQPHAGEAERLGRSLSVGAQGFGKLQNGNPDDSLRHRLNNQLKGVFA